MQGLPLSSTGLWSWDGRNGEAKSLLKAKPQAQIITIYAITAHTIAMYAIPMYAITISAISV